MTLSLTVIRSVIKRPHDLAFTIKRLRVATPPGPKSTLTDTLSVDFSSTTLPLWMRVPISTKAIEKYLDEGNQRLYYWCDVRVRAWKLRSPMKDCTLLGASGWYSVFENTLHEYQIVAFHDSHAE